MWLLSPHTINLSVAVCMLHAPLFPASGAYSYFAVSCVSYVRIADSPVELGMHVYMAYHPLLLLLLLPPRTSLSLRGASKLCCCISSELACTREGRSSCSHAFSRSWVFVTTVGQAQNSMAYTVIIKLKQRTPSLAAIGYGAILICVLIYFIGCAQLKVRYVM